jgi:hypothetical protein
MIRLSGRYDDIPDNPKDLEKDHSLAHNSWITPAGTFFPTYVDPRTGRADSRSMDKQHDEWLREYAQWLEENHGILPVSEDDLTGFPAISKGWIRKAGFEEYLTYTISETNAKQSAARIKQNIMQHIDQLHKKRKDIRGVKITIASMSAPDDISVLAEFSAKDLEDNGYNLGRTIQRYRINNRAASKLKELSVIASNLELMGQYDIVDRIDALIRYSSNIDC